MARPVNAKLQPMHTDIKQFENYAGFEKIRTSMLLKEEGKETLYIPRNETSESVYMPGTGNTIKAKYLWKKVPDVPVIVCLKVMTEDLKRRDLKNVRSECMFLCWSVEGPVFWGIFGDCQKALHRKISL
jgi:hypothetical protein